MDSNPTTSLSLVAPVFHLKLRYQLKKPNWTSHGQKPPPNPNSLTCPFVVTVNRGFRPKATESPSTEDLTPTTTTTTNRRTATPTTTTSKTSPRTPKVLPTKANNNNIPSAARLPYFINHWRQVTNNSWILRVVKEGYKLQFDPDPPPPRPFVHTSYSPSSKIIRCLLSDYLSKGAILVVDVRPDQYVSRIFEVPKKTGDHRLILDLSDLNCYLKRIHFKMEGLETIASLICLNDFLASLDCQDAFLTIAMHPDCYKYLCFDFEGVRYCFIALVFGLTCAPRIFSKLLKVPLSFMRTKGIKNSAWLDDILLVASSSSESSEDIQYSKSFLESLGFIIKTSKSNLTPSQTLQHVGFIWDTANYTVSIPHDKVNGLKNLCFQALSHPTSLRFLAKIIGTIDSFKFGCPIAPLHYRSLQQDLIKHLCPEDNNWNSTIFLSSSARSDLLWWLECDLDLRPASLASFSPSHQIETDASLVGWGAYQHSDSFVQARWSPSDSLLHINYLELKAVFLAIRSLFSGSSPISLLILCDNIPTVSYINHMGGTKSPFLCQLSLDLWEYCLAHNIWLKAVYFRGEDNVRADRLSRFFSDNHDYYLSNSWFSRLHSHLDFCLELDLFASLLHHHLPRYSSRLPDPDSEFIDAFSRPWYGNLYLFPPIILLSRVLNKFITDNCQFGLLIAPCHPSSPSFSTLLDLCISPPIFLPDTAVIREPRHCKVSQMMAWTISCNPSLRKDYLRTLSPDCSRTSKTILSRNTSLIGTNSVVGSTKGKLVQMIYL